MAEYNIYICIYMCEPPWATWVPQLATRNSNLISDALCLRLATNQGCCRTLIPWIPMCRLSYVQLHPHQVTVGTPCSNPAYDQPMKRPRSQMFPQPSLGEDILRKPCRGPPPFNPNPTAPSVDGVLLTEACLPSGCEYLRPLSPIP